MKSSEKSGGKSTTNLYDILMIAGFSFGLVGIGIPQIHQRYYEYTNPSVARYSQVSQEIDLLIQKDPHTPRCDVPTCSVGEKNNRSHLVISTKYSELSDLLGKPGVKSYAQSNNYIGSLGAIMAIYGMLTFFGSTLYGSFIESRENKLRRKSKVIR